MTKKKLQIVHLGISGFPHNVTLAPIQKSYLIYKGLIEAGAEVRYINTIPQVTRSDQYSGNSSGNSDGIDYIYTGGTPYRSENFLARNWTKLKGAVLEVPLLLSLVQQNKIDVAILYTSHFSVLLYYRALSKLLRFSLVMNYVEYRSAFDTNSISRKISWYLTDRFAPALVDGILPISEFLIEHVKRQAPQTPYLKVPALCDFSRYEGLNHLPGETRYLLYCGSAAYFEVANFIIASFELLQASDVFLHLIINGWPNQMEKIHQRISESNKKAFIRTFSNVSNEDYAQLLFRAEGLLIPLRPTVQDTARFPNKVGEYVASGNPMVTTSVGEISYYFEDQVTAFVANAYAEDDFARKMQYLVDNPDEAKQVGAAARQLGRQAFDYQHNGLLMRDFLCQILGREPLHS